MSSSEPNAKGFASYPPEARRLALANQSLLQELPLVFAAILLREIIAFDWKFPAERLHLEDQLRLLAALPSPELNSRMQGFAAIKLSPDLEQSNWVVNPAGFMEKLTAWLWSTGQMQNFQASAEQYAAAVAAASPVARPPLRRLCIVVIGQGVPETDYPLFRKLRPHGVYLKNVNPEGGLELLLAAAAKRSAHPASHVDKTSADRYAHWYIDGGAAMPVLGLTQLSYQSLQQPRSLLLTKIQRAIDSGSMDPEALRSMIAQMQPDEIGLGGSTDPVLSRFQMSLLTEGSGTQIFATTFVQWAARECLRRAQPETLVTRYSPRQEMQPMNVMLSGAKAGALDPHGSLIDADMGAYYTWINMNRLSGADEMSFLTWFEGHSQAIAIGPDIPQATTSDSPMDMHQVLALLS
jgi:hypothetical protein